MNWTAYIDSYCERLLPGFWDEPLNAVSNLAFWLAAMVARLCCRLSFRVDGLAAAVRPQRLAQA